MSSSKARYLAIVKLGFPILVGQLGMIVVGFVDTYMVGRYSTEALASASFVNNLFNVAILACIGFTYGMTPLVGALFGRGESRRIGLTVKVGVAMNLLFALAVTALMTVVYFNLHRLGQPPELLPTIRPYFITYLGGIVAVALANLLAQWSYAINRSQLPMWVILVSNVINIVLNWVLIYGHAGMPELGLLGAGYATLAARWFMALTMLGIFLLAKPFEEYCRGFFRERITRNDVREMWRVSWPVSLQMTLETSAFSLSAIMAGWLGKVELASFQVVMTIGTLGFFIYYSVASAVSVIVANYAGRDDHAEMRRTAFAGFRLLLVVATLSSTLFIVAGKWLVEMATDDAAVVTMSVALIVPLVVYQFCDATQINFACALRGTSRVKVMSWIAFVSYMVVGLPITYLLAFPAGLGIDGIVYSFAVSLGCAAALFIYFFMRYTAAKSSSSCGDARGPRGRGSRCTS